jgi:aerotaxis receptor
VVAGEVKALAAQTAKATDEIAQQIAGLRGATGAAVIAVGEIGHTLGEVAQVAVSVAAAIEEQTAATQEIARNVAESGAAVQEVTARIGEVSSEAQTTGDQAGQLRAISDKVATDIASLRGALVHTVRTATTEADRRMETRTQVREPCTVRLGVNGRQVEGTVCDLAHGGAAIQVGDGVAGQGDTGTVALSRHGGAQARFVVSTSGSDGRVHVRFTATDPAFDRALQTLLDVPREARRA